MSGSAISDAAPSFWEARTERTAIDQSSRRARAAAHEALATAAQDDAFMEGSRAGIDATNRGERGIPLHPIEAEERTRLLSGWLAQVDEFQSRRTVELNGRTLTPANEIIREMREERDAEFTGDLH